MTDEQPNQGQGSGGALVPSGDRSEQSGGSGDPRLSIENYRKTMAEEEEQKRRVRALADKSNERKRARSEQARAAEAAAEQQAKPSVPVVVSQTAQPGLPIALAEAKYPIVYKPEGTDYSLHSDRSSRVGGRGREQIKVGRGPGFNFDEATDPQRIAAVSSIHGNRNNQGNINFGGMQLNVTGDSNTFNLGGDQARLDDLHRKMQDLLKGANPPSGQQGAYSRPLDSQSGPNHGNHGMQALQALLDQQTYLDKGAAKVGAMTWAAVGLLAISPFAPVGAIAIAAAGAAGVGHVLGWQHEREKGRLVYGLALKVFEAEERDKAYARARQASPGNFNGAPDQGSIVTDAGYGDRNRPQRSTRDEEMPPHDGQIQSRAAMRPNNFKEIAGRGTGNRQSLNS